MHIQLSGNGAWVENKTQSLTFHYRDVPENDQESYKTRAMNIIESYGFLANPAHAAVEAKPPVVWNKGTKHFAVDIFMRTFSNIYISNEAHSLRR